MEERGSVANTQWRAYNISVSERPKKSGMQQC